MEYDQLRITHEPQTSLGPERDRSYATMCALEQCRELRLVVLRHYETAGVCAVHVEGVPGALEYDSHQGGYWGDGFWKGSLAALLKRKGVR